MEEAVSTFCSITGASPEIAQSFIALSGNDVSRAIELFFENPELASSVQTGVPASQPSAPPRSNLGRQDSSGVIHIDSDDDDDIMQVDDDDSDVENSRAAAAQAAAVAQEEEDAAMAKRLQEELYQENHGSGSGTSDLIGEDGVRAPIGRTTETLVAPDPAWGVGGDHDVDAALLEQVRRRRIPPGRRMHHLDTSNRLTYSLHSPFRRPLWTGHMGGLGKLFDRCPRREWKTCATSR